MKFITCTYAGVENVGILTSSGYYNIINSNGAYLTQMNIESLFNVKELSPKSTSENGQVSLVELLGGKPQNLTINF